MFRARYRSSIAFALLFAIAMAYFEAAVVVYLRQLYYPDGFSFPLRIAPTKIIVIELIRELSTLVILVAVAAVAAKRFWERFGYFVMIFGVWDIFFYVWLKATTNWPSSLLEWDVLFLLPVPWIGPVIAPVLVALMMAVAGFLIIRLFALGYTFRPTSLGWLLAILGTAAILYSFMRDTDAGLRGQMPQPYLYYMLIIGLMLYIAGFIHCYRRSRGGGSL
ncbi:MAG: hypothetical protein OEW00_12615 [candidate division Zixibacteria bacterium]|nr:hypothetical protein [candidate division Zixibacteria bacterium]